MLSALSYLITHRVVAYDENRLCHAIMCDMYT